MLVQKSAFKGMELEFLAPDTPNINDFILQIVQLLKASPCAFTSFSLSLSL